LRDTPNCGHRGDLDHPGPTLKWPVNEGQTERLNIVPRVLAQEVPWRRETSAVRAASSLKRLVSLSGEHHCPRICQGGVGVAAMSVVRARDTVQSGDVVTGYEISSSR